MYLIFEGAKGLQRCGALMPGVAAQADGCRCRCHSIRAGSQAAELPFGLHKLCITCTTAHRNEIESEADERGERTKLLDHSPCASISHFSANQPSALPFNTLGGPRYLVFRFTPHFRSFDPRVASQLGFLGGIACCALFSRFRYARDYIITIIFISSPTRILLDQPLGPFLVHSRRLTMAYSIETVTHHVRPCEFSRPGLREQKPK